MAKDEIIVVGRVLEVFPNALFKVEVEEQHHILAVPAGRLRIRNIRIVEGDNVRVALSPYDLTRGRIIWNLRNSKEKAQ